MLDKSLAKCCESCLENKGPVQIQCIGPESCNAFGLYKLSLNLDHLRSEWRSLFLIIQNGQLDITKLKNYIDYKKSSGETEALLESISKLARLEANLPLKKQLIELIEEQRKIALEIYQQYKFKNFKFLAVDENIQPEIITLEEIEQKLKRKGDKKASWCFECQQGGDAGGGCGSGCIGEDQCSHYIISDKERILKEAVNLWKLSAASVRQVELTIAGLKQRMKWIMSNSEFKGEQIENSKHSEINQEIVRITNLIQKKKDELNNKRSYRNGLLITISKLKADFDKLCKKKYPFLAKTLISKTGPTIEILKEGIREVRRRTVRIK